MATAARTEHAILLGIGAGLGLSAGLALSYLAGRQAKKYSLELALLEGELAVVRPHWPPQAQCAQRACTTAQAMPKLAVIWVPWRTAARDG